ncbi:hypothetical protein H6P81_000807 [Aristolochia fimbriata]|uniref:Uncharacterized protein n=1 Tax=Aristolochia fimbriata TaxID=158543 RepID=A0AAV7F5X3_ARIFI|nr:hypothetical protein H6P81_000807 [Aristolochia fimbriata]
MVKGSPSRSSFICPCVVSPSHYRLRSVEKLPLSLGRTAERMNVGLAGPCFPQFHCVTIPLPLQSGGLGILSSQCDSLAADKDGSSRDISSPKGGWPFGVLRQRWKRGPMIFIQSTRKCSIHGRRRYHNHIQRQVSLANFLSWVDTQGEGKLSFTVPRFFFLQVSPSALRGYPADHHSHSANALQSR